MNPSDFEQRRLPSYDQKARFELQSIRDYYFEECMKIYSERTEEILQTDLCGNDQVHFAKTIVETVEKAHISSLF